LALEPSLLACACGLALEGFGGDLDWFEGDGGVDCFPAEEGDGVLIGFVGKVVVGCLVVGVCACVGEGVRSLERKE
jgi:hypothetical protein